MKTNKDFDIEKNLGVLIFPDGEIYSFGVMSYAPVSKLNEFNYHDPAFMKTLYQRKDFRRKLEELGIIYDEEYSVHVNSEDFAAKGIISILNSSSLSNDGYKNKLYAVYVPSKLSSIQLDLLNSNYEYIKSIEDREGYFEVMVFQSDGSYDIEDYITRIDDLYDLINRKNKKRTLK